MITPAGYTDYLFSSPTLADLGAALQALQAAGLVETGDVPENMLGDPQTVTINGPVDPVTHLPAQIPLIIRAKQDGNGVWHVAVRTVVPPSAVPFDPATLGLTADTPATSAAVLGSWA